MRMRATPTPEANRRSILAPIGAELVGLAGPALRLIAPPALRSLALIAMVGLLIGTVLPAVLVAAARATSAA